MQFTVEIDDETYNAAVDRVGAERVKRLINYHTLRTLRSAKHRPDTHRILDFINNHVHESTSISDIRKRFFEVTGHTIDEKSFATILSNLNRDDIIERTKYGHYRRRSDLH